MKSDDFERKYTYESVPVLIDNDNKSGSVAYEKWTFSFFQERYGDIEIDLSDDPIKRGIVTQKRKIGDYLKMIDGQEINCPYHVGWAYEKSAPELNNDFMLPTCSPNDFIDLLPVKMQFRRRWIFFGKKDLYSDLHVDCFSCNGWIYMIQGKKTIRCVSPLYENMLESHDSLFDDNVVSKIKDFGGCVLEFILIPGSVFYLPSGWSHHVRNDTNTIMVTQNFTTNFDVLRFYRNYRKLISKDVNECDHIYKKYILQLSLNDKLPPEKISLIDNEIKILDQELFELQTIRTFLESLKLNE